jgi:hypothetical protein
LQINLGVFPLYICCRFRVIKFHFGGRSNLLNYNSDAEGPRDCSSAVFVAEEADGRGEKGLGNNTSVDLVFGSFSGGLTHLETIPQL